MNVVLPVTFLDVNSLFHKLAMKSRFSSYSTDGHVSLLAQAWRKTLWWWNLILGGPRYQKDGAAVGNDFVWRSLSTCSRSTACPERKSMAWIRSLDLPLLLEEYLEGRVSLAVGYPCSILCISGLHCIQSMCFTLTAILDLRITCFHSPYFHNQRVGLPLGCTGRLPVEPP